MSRLRVFILVEGKVLDPAFYSQMMSSIPEVSSAGFDVRLIEQVTRGSKRAGGKLGSLKLHDYYRRRGWLKQSTASGHTVIVFMLDQDFDHVLGTRRRSQHVVYTRTPDVEGEIFAHSDLSRGLQVALSLTEREAENAAISFGNPARRVHDMWREWINIGCLYYGLKSTCSLRPGGPSAINVDSFGAQDLVQSVSALSQIRLTAQTPRPGGREKQIRNRLDAIRGRGDYDLLVKGKWISLVMSNWVQNFDFGRNVDKADFSRAITKALLLTIDFSASWTLRYRDSLCSLLE